MIDKKEFFNKVFFLDGNDIEIVKKLAIYYEEWCYWNKSRETIEVRESEEFSTIIVVHQLFDNYIKVCNGWEFVSDIKYFLKEYSNQTKEDYEYMLNFWEDKVKYLGSIHNDKLFKRLSEI